MTWKNGEYEPQQQRANDKKTQILDAALLEFSEIGYHGTTAKKIAARASVATGSFYRYFKDKKAVFMALCLRMESEIGGAIFEYGHSCRAKGHSEPEVLKLLAEFALMAHHDDKDFHKELLAMEMSDLDVRKWVMARRSRVICALTAFLEERREEYRVDDLEAAAEMIYGVIEDVSHRVVVFDSIVGETRSLIQLNDLLRRYLFD